MTNSVFGLDRQLDIENVASHVRNKIMSRMSRQEVHAELEQRASNPEIGLTFVKGQSKADIKNSFMAAISRAKATNLSRHANANNEKCVAAC